MSDKKVTTKRNRRKSEQSVEIVPLLASGVLSPAERQRQRLARIDKQSNVATDAQKAKLLRLMHQGELPVDICDKPGMPTLSAFRRAMLTDEQFASDYEDAYSVMADMALEDAQRYVRDCTETGNLDTVRAAEVYSKALIALLEKLAPRSHGALVKHAGSDAGPLQVAVINYAAPIKT